MKIYHFALLGLTSIEYTSGHQGDIQPVKVRFTSSLTGAFNFS